MEPIKLSVGSEAALRRLEEHGYEAYIVGGCVRDSLLGRIPHDWDLTTNARPEQTAACFADCRVIETGIKHGTVTVLMNGEALEITTYRRDGAYADNRHPIEVTFSKTIGDDLSRRDFTVNAMAYHPERGLVDLFGGENDLSNGVIRCVGDPRTRFEEDGLRILRAIRFASVLGFRLDPETDRQVRACRGLLNNIAAERVREEFNKLLLGKGAVDILRDYTDVILQFLPELSNCVGFDHRSRYHCYDVWEHILHALAETDSPDLRVRLAILFHDIGKPACCTEDEHHRHFHGHAEAGVQIADGIMHRLRYDNATRETVLKLIRLHDLPLNAEKKRVKRLLTKMTEQEVLELLELARCDRLAHAPEYAEPSEALAEIPKIIDELKAENACLSLKTLAVKGDDLIALGIPAGKQIGTILQTLLEKVLDGEIENDKTSLLKEANNQITKL